MIDFIIVGQGLAANTLAHSFYKHNISFKIVGNQNLSSCSKVAGGIWNPIVFKRFTKSWLADELIPELNRFYTDCERVLNKKLITQRPILKPFAEEQEKVLWQKKAQTELSAFLDAKIHSSDSFEFANCKFQSEYGSVMQAGNLDVEEYINASSLFFADDILSETFAYEQLKITEDAVVYKEISAKHLVFCEGYLVKNNPFFKWIPLKPAKGEILTIKTADLNFKGKILNKNGFIMDINPSTYKLGATYAWDDLTEAPTEAGLKELKQKLENIVTCNYSILNHQAGIRPSSLDRRPIIGQHPHHKRLFVFNGLGTKGVMLAPFFAKNFVNFYLQKQALHAEVDLKRFYNLYAG